MNTIKTVCFRTRMPTTRIVRTSVSSIKPGSLTALVGMGLLTLLGCNVDAQYQKRLRPVDKVGAPPQRITKGGVDIDVTDSQEVDLVESVITHRDLYRQNLERLHDYYATKGYSSKRDWAAFELGGLRKIRGFRYIQDAEIPSGDLRPVASIAEADSVYQKGLAYMRAGGHGIPGVYREDRMVQAAETFRELIHRYPNSDKIDEAAFYLGEIHKEYLPDQEPIAVKWYERSLQWNPQTEHPVRFQAAVVYDYRLHDRDRALELYKAVLSSETASGSNVEFATRRIAELTRETGGESSARTANSP